jgi:hypothetical protein
VDARIALAISELQGRRRFPQKAGQAKRLALFDMDRVLVDGRFITCLAQRTNKIAELSEFLDHYEIPADERCRKIAALFAGVPRTVFEQTAKDIPLTQGAAQHVVTGSLLDVVSIVAKHNWNDASAVEMLQPAP